MAWTAVLLAATGVVPRANDCLHCYAPEWFEPIDFEARQHSATAVMAANGHKRTLQAKQSEPTTANIDWEKAVMRSLGI